jgi:hypothetical protein
MPVACPLPVHPAGLPMTTHRPTALRALCCASTLAAAVLAAGCAQPPAAPPPKARVHVVTDQAELVSFDAAAPGQPLARQPLQGLPPGERLVGMDYRVARGVLYALGSDGRLYTLDVATARLQPVAAAPALRLPAGAVGFDFNPAADRIRVVVDDGSNLRLHPDSGALAAADPALQYAAGDAAQGQAPRLAGAAYTYNKKDEKLTTNYAIDRARGTLVTQGSVEGVAPAVSPNTGRLYTVGPLGTGSVDDAAFDIADIDNTALAALRLNGQTRLYVVDLQTGKARDLGAVAGGRALWGLAIEP